MLFELFLLKVATLQSAQPVKASNYLNATSMSIDRLQNALSAVVFISRFKFILVFIADFLPVTSNLRSAGLTLDAAAVQDALEKHTALSQTASAAFVAGWTQAQVQARVHAFSYKIVRSGTLERRKSGQLSQVLGF